MMNIVFGFGLSDLKYFDATKLFSDKARKDEDEVVLAIALAFNDLKGLLLFYDLLMEHHGKFVISSAKISALTGQYGGLRWQLNRLLMATILEVVKLIDSNRSVFGRPTLKRAIDKLDGPYASAWKFLYFFSEENANLSGHFKTIKTMMVRVRNNITFHYYDPRALGNAYKQAFKKPMRDDGRAYFCMGESVEKSRFHFADAAVEEFIESLYENLDNRESIDRAFWEVIKSVMECFCLIVENYIKQIQGGITHLGAADKLYEKGPTRSTQFGKGK